MGCKDDTERKYACRLAVELHALRKFPDGSKIATYYQDVQLPFVPTKGTYLAHPVVGDLEIRDVAYDYIEGLYLARVRLFISNATAVHRCSEDFTRAGFTTKFYSKVVD